MSKPSPQKQKKQKERDQRNRHKKLDRERRQALAARKIEYAQKYPGFVFDSENGDPEFVELVKQAVAQIDFADRSVFQAWEAEVFRIIKQGGWKAGSARMNEIIADAKERGFEGAELGEVCFAVHLGQVVFDLIGETELAKHLPVNDVAFYFGGGDVVGRFDSLLRAKGSGGTVYYSRKRPTLEIDGEKKIVAFSKHAIDRTCDRIKPDRKSYAAVCDVFCFLNYCVYFERCDLDGGQIGFTFYDMCGKAPFWQAHYVTDVLGQENVDPAKGECCYRVGYCPAIIEGGFIKAKTLLLPGFAKTPEYGAILRSSLNRREKQEMIEKAKHLDAGGLWKSNDFSVIKWFHDNGVPQVVQLQTPVFDYK
jgi:hypothetical protein